MIRELLTYIKKEKLYVFLFLLMAGFLIFGAHFSKDFKQEQEQSQQPLQDFKKAEKNLQDEIKKAGSMQNYLKKNPELRFPLQTLSLGFILFFGAGLAVLISYCIRRDWRAKWQVISPTPTTPWQLDMLFKVVVQFMLAAIGFSLLLGLVRKFVWPGMSDNALILIHTALIDSTAFYLIYRMIQSRGGDWRELGFRLPEGKFFKEIGMAWTAYLGILPLFGVLLIALLGIAEWLKYEPPPHPLVNVFLEEETRAPGLIRFSLFLAIFFGPFFEEVFFRGFCYNIFKRRWGRIWAMVLSSAFFAFIHDSTFAFWPIFLLGMGLAWLYEKRGSLLPCVVMHVTHNLIFIGYFFLAKDVVEKAGG